MSREQQLEKALTELLIAVEFGGVTNLGSEAVPNPGYKAYVPDDFVINAHRALSANGGAGE